MTTATLLCTTNSGWIQSSSNVDYATARAGTGALSLNDSGAYAHCGQDFDSPTNYVMEGFLEFDLTGVTAGSSIDNTPVLSLFAALDETGAQEFDVQARSHDYGVALATGDYVAGASLSSKTLLAHKTTAGWSAVAYVALTDDAMAAACAAAAGGFLRMLLCSDRTVAGTTATVDEHMWFYAENGTGVQDAKLVFDWTAPSADTGPAIIGGGFF